MRSSCLRVISRIQNGLIHAAFSRWRAEAGRYRRLHLICKNIVLRLQNRQLATALTAWRLAVKQLVTEALVVKQRTEHASAQAAEGASAALRIAEARAAKLENELAESNREARHARLQYEEITARLVEANRARDAATELYEQLSNMETRTEELETIRYANQELCVEVSRLYSLRPSCLGNTSFLWVILV
jgi:signal recognition particle GTPase